MFRLSRDLPQRWNPVDPPADVTSCLAAIEVAPRSQGANYLDPGAAALDVDVRISAASRPRAEWERKRDRSGDHIYVYNYNESAAFAWVVALDPTASSQPDP
jgi:hypothetical protein